MTPSILFVDDEESVTDGLRRRFRHSEFDVRTANDATSALNALEAQPVDVVVSDHCMPGMTGVELLCRVRERWPETVRVILTGQADLDATIQAVNDARVFRFLTKPCDFAEIEATARAAVKARESSMRAKRVLDVQEDEKERAVVLLEQTLPEVWMAYQPLVFASSWALAGYEALVRAPDLSPPALFELAQAAEMRAHLESHIWECVSADVATAPQGSTIFVNVHPECLSSAELFESDFPLARFANQVVLEITENAPLDGIADLGEKLAYLRSRGFRVALDDLGAGYAGLNSFAALSPDIVKFDMELVQRFRESPTNAKLIRSIVRLCAELGIKTVAEGIETEDQALGLRELGCDLLQGYYFGRAAKPFVAVEAEQ